MLSAAGATIIALVQNRINLLRQADTFMGVPTGRLVYESVYISQFC